MLAKIKETYPEHWPQYFTATIYQWKDLLKNDLCKNIIVDSLIFLVVNKRMRLYAFVIMSNHIHVIWQPLFGFTPSDIQASFMKQTAKQLKRFMEKNNKDFLQEFKVNKYDRTYQVWKREPLSIELITPSVYEQKLNYIHLNPVKAGLCNFPEEYKYSSARFYYNGHDEFNIMTHFVDN